MESLKTWVEKRPLIATSLILLLALITATFACTTLLLARIAYTQQSWYSFMLWNLTLAWVPLILAMSAQARFIHSRWYLFVPLLTVWLLFLPNAPYMMTDLIHMLHLPYSESTILWFDLVMLLMFAFTGLFITFASLRLMQITLAGIIGRFPSWLLTFIIITLCAYGIVVGRVLRWNSWDILTRPSQVLASIANTFLQPVIHIQFWAMVVSISFILLSGYLVITAFSRLPQTPISTPAKKQFAQPVKATPYPSPQQS